MSEAEAGPAPEARELTAFQKNVLAVLAREPMYGLAIKRELEQYYGEEVNHGRLYPNLDELVELGLVEKSALDKRTNQYALTELGVEAIGSDLEWALSRFVTDEDRADRIRRVIEDA